MTAKLSCQRSNSSFVSTLLRDIRHSLKFSCFALKSQLSYGFVGGVCNFLGSVSSQQKLEGMAGAVLQSRITSSSYSSVLFRKQRKIHLRDLREGRPKRCEEKRSLQLSFGPSFYMFFLLPASLSYVNWASQEGCLFYLRFSLQSLDLPLFYFQGFSHSHFGLLFPILTT